MVRGGRDAGRREQGEGAGGLGGGRETSQARRINGDYKVMAVKPRQRRTFSGKGEDEPRTVRDDDEEEDELDHDEDGPAAAVAVRDRGPLIQDELVSRMSYLQTAEPSELADSAERHGFGFEEEHLRELEMVYYLYWQDSRHESGANPTRQDPSQRPLLQDWRMRERLKTVSAALVLCLNVGVDPPDVFKTNPCAKLECWIDPFALPPSKALESIGRNMQQQYETLSLRTRYKQYLDPSVEETKKFSCSLRRNAKDERILFHYNGHGVPKPTASGEIWVFNKSYTQYIPVSLHDLQTWLGSPCIFVWDCSCAGNILTNFNKFAEQRDLENQRKQEAKQTSVQSDDEAASTTGPPIIPMSECIQLAACRGSEVLPMNPDLPADLFTCCLTSPIEIALRWFILRNPLPSQVTVDLVMKLPGKLQDRRTPLGELNWIFTAITDTIAWNVLPRDLFKKLFRQDLMVAALFRNFLLAERIMRFYQCHPQSHPALPPSHDHPIWNSWDLAVDTCLAQLPAMLAAEAKSSAAPSPSTPTSPTPATVAAVTATSTANGTMTPGSYEYQHSTFFTEQLTAFEIWLAQGAVTKKPPDQLPIVLQVLLSQVHRLRALILLSKFLDFGPWAVNLALSIGIFPYVLKLLQSPAPELRPVLIFIWARILAVDKSCQSDLLKDNGYHYFLSVLTPPNTTSTGTGGTGHSGGFPSYGSSIQIPNVSEHRAMCAFIIAMFCRDFRAGQMACLKANVMDACLYHLLDPDPLLRQWACLCLAQLWTDHEEAVTLAIRDLAHEKIISVLNDPVPEVRSAALNALSAFLSQRNSPTPEDGDLELMLLLSATQISGDGSPPVRKELLILFSHFVMRHTGRFIVTAYAALEEDAILHRNRKRAGDVGDSPLSPSGKGAGAQQSHAATSAYTCVWRALLAMTADPYTEVATMACTVVDAVTLMLLQSQYANVPDSAVRTLPPPSLTPASLHALAPSEPLQSEHNRHTAHQSVAGNWKRRDSRSDAGVVAVTSANLVSTMKRSSSVANALKQLAIQGYYHLADPYHPQNNFKDVHATNGQHDTSDSLSHTDHAVHAPMPHVLRFHYMPPNLSTLTPCPPTSESPSQDSLHFMGARNSRPSSRRPSVAETTSELIASDDAKLLKRRTESGVSTPVSGYQGSIPQSPVLSAKESLPFESAFFDWSCEYFFEPQMRPAEADEPGSVDYNQRLWRRVRNEKVIYETQPMKEIAGSSRWDERVRVMKSEGPVSHLVYHQFEPHLVTADNADVITVWNWQDGTRLNCFSNSNPAKSRITSVRFLNEDDIALLLVGSAEGNIRIYRRYESPEHIQLVTAFRALSDLVPSNLSSGLVADWQQGRGTLLVGGDVKIIRVWDAPREVCISEIPARSSSCVTSLTSDQVAGNIIAAGFGNGAIRVYDRRHPPRDAMVRVYKEHTSWIANIQMQRGGKRELISGSVSGDVHLWDIRSTKSIRKVEAHRSGLANLAVHEHAPVFATCSALGYVKVWNTAGPNLCTFQPFGGTQYSDYLHHRPPTPYDPTGRTGIKGSSHLARPSGLNGSHPQSAPSQSPVHSISFHPHHMSMAIGSQDAIGLYKTSTTVY